jgi:sugar lactone lactonase YvrE/PKD repeat protein
MSMAVEGSGNLYIADTLNNRIRMVNASGIISTVAGNGTAGYSGDGGAATNAELDNPWGVAVDGSGNLYIADCENNRIRMVNISGIINTVAGNGSLGYSGDGGAATSAKLLFPSGVAVDGSGNLYLADKYNNAIRMVNTSGIINTVADNGTWGYSGDGGAATSAELNCPAGVVLDSSGNLYIADWFNNRIRMVNTSGIISTVAGNGKEGYSGDGEAATNAELDNPGGVTMDGSGNLYIADTRNNRIRMVNTSGIISTVAGGGTGGLGDGGAATNAELNYPIGVALDSSGNLYIADCYNNLIRMVNKSTGFINTVAGNGTGGYSGDGEAATSAELNCPTGVALDSSGNLYIADTNNNCVRMVNMSGIISTVAGDGTWGYSGDGGDATSAELGYPFRVTVDSSGNLYIADENNNCIRMVNKSTSIISTVAGNGTQGYAGDGGAATSAELNCPTDVALDGIGNFYIADFRNNRIRKIILNAPAASQLTIVQVTDGGVSPTVGRVFNVEIEACDSGGNQAIVSQNTNIALTLLTGTGTLSGVLTGTLASGTGYLTISGVIYSKAESGVVLTATATSGDTLSPANSTPFTILGNQTISFAALPVETFGDTDFAPGATTSSGLPVSYASSDETIATIVGGNIHIVGAGSCIITASQSGDADYTAAANINQTLTVNQAGQTITFAALLTETFGDADFSPGATTSSGLPVSYASSDATVATIVGGNIHIIGVGSCIITALQSGNANYSAAANVQQTLTIKTSAGGGSNTPPAFLSPPMMNPNAGSITAGEVVTFTAAATDAAGDFIDYSWNFGDETYGSGANPTHTFTSAGLYPVTVTVSNGVANDTFTLYVGVNSPGGTGTNPNQFQVQKASIKFKFQPNDPKIDTMTLSGTLPMLAGFIPKSQVLTVIVGDYESDFTLTANGTASSASGNSATGISDIESIKLVGVLKNGAYSTNKVKFFYTLKKKDLFSYLEDYGFNNANVKPAIDVNLPVLFSLDNNFYLDTPTLSYRAKKGKTGSAKK